MFSNTDDAYAKLGKCVIAYKDEPYAVGSIEYADSLSKSNPKYALNIRRAELPDISSSYKDKIELEDRAIDWRNLGEHLGYNNNSQYQGAVYVSRMPVRKTVFGLRNDNINCTPVPTPVSPSYPNGVKGIQFSSLLTKDFLKMWNAKYPTLKEVISEFEINPEVRSIAFHKKFAVNKKSIGPFFLEYRGRDIGWSDDIEKFTLDRSFRYLTETLEYYGVDFK